MPGLLDGRQPASVEGVIANTPARSLPVENKPIDADAPTMDTPQPLPPGVPHPPSKEDVAQISQAQTLIGDEWGDNPPPTNEPASDPLG